MWLLCHTLSTGHISQCFHTWHSIDACLSCSVSLIVSILLIPWSRMFGSQVTNMQTLPDPTFLEPYNCNIGTIDWDTLSLFFCHFLQYKPWLCVGVLWKMSIFCVSYMQIHILMSDDCEAEILGSDNVVPTIPPCKQFQSVPYFLLVRVASTVRGRR